MREQKQEDTPRDKKNDKECTREWLEGSKKTK